MPKTSAPPAMTLAGLRLSPLFAAWEDARLTKILPACHLVTLRRGDYAWHTGEAARVFTIIRAGLVKIRRMSAAGDESIVAIFGPRESIGDTAAVDHGHYPADAVVLSPAAELLRIDSSAIFAGIAGRPELAQALNDLLLRHTRALEQKIRIMTAGSVPRRLATLFLLIAARFGEIQADGRVLIPIALTRAEIAGLIGATVETVIRALSPWRKSKVVSTDSRGYPQIDRARLRAALHEGP